MRPRILVPQPIHEAGLRLLRDVGDVEVVETDRMLTREELKAALSRCEYFLSIGDLPLDADILDAGVSLRGISAVAAHPDEWMDIEAATARGIPVTGLTRGPVVKTTADLTIAFILGLAWRLVEADRWVRAGRFRQEQSVLFMGRSLEGRTLGLIGFGQVARAVAKRAQRARAAGRLHEAQSPRSVDRTRARGDLASRRSTSCSATATSSASMPTTTSRPTSSSASASCAA